MKKLIIAVAASAGFALPVFAGDLAKGPMVLTDAQLDGVTAGTGDCGCEEPPKVKGNNGWGNGIDPTNPGSDNGNFAQSQSKQNLSYPGRTATLEDRFGGR